MNKSEILKQLLNNGTDTNANLSALELARASGVDLNKVHGISQRYLLRLTGPCIARFLDLNLDLNQVVNDDGEVGRDEVLSFIISNSKFDNNDISIVNHVLAQLNLDSDMNRLRAAEVLIDRMLQTPFNVGFSNWIRRYVLCRKLRNWCLGRSFEETAPVSQVANKDFDEDKEVESIDFFGVDADTEEPLSPFRATGVSIVFCDQTTLTMGASGPVIPVYNDCLEDEDAAGKELHLYLPEMASLPFKLINCRYSYHPLKSERPNVKRICFVTRLHFCTYMLTIKAVKSFEHIEEPYDSYKEMLVDSERFLQCVIEPFNGIDYDTFWEYHSECF